jgi:glycosyltransferase involved in cell wall biosynthesis
VTSGKDLVSTILPCHNAERWLRDAIDSVLAQTWRPIEVIVVDDGSTDASLAVCEAFSEDPLVRVIAQTHQGAAAARNAGVRAAKGAWFQFLDADDLLAPNKIEVQLERATSEGTQFLYSCTWGRFLDSPLNWVPDQSDLCDDDLDPVEWIVRKYSTNCMMATAAWLVPREILQRESGWNESLVRNNDGEYFDRLVLAAQGVKHVANARCFYRTGHATGLSSTRTRAAMEAERRGIEAGCRRLLAVEDTQRTRSACGTRLWLFAYEFYPYAPDLANNAARAALQLGVERVRMPGRLSLNILARMVGWRRAKRIQYEYYKRRYRNK